MYITDTCTHCHKLTYLLLFVAVAAPINFKQSTLISTLLSPSRLPVVLVKCGGTWGTGLIVDQDLGVVLTCGHVVKNSRGGTLQCCHIIYYIFPAKSWIILENMC